MNSRPRVLHVNDVASVASTLVGTAQLMGLPWRLRHVPPGRGALPVVAAKRLVDLPPWLIMRRQADIVHVHYATNGYYGWGVSRGFVLHIHGSDIRRDAQSPVLGPIVRRSIRGADRVLYSTPDLASWVAPLRPDASWLPNAVTPLFLRAVPAPVTAPRRVIFNMRWDDTKGGQRLVRAAGRLVASGVEVHGLDWGADAGLARGAGVTLHPLMDKAGYRDFLSSGAVIVGQQVLGSLTVSDLESLAVGRPLVVRSDEPGVPCLDSTLETLVDRVADLLAHPASALDLGRAGREWVEIQRRPEKSVQRLIEIYSSL